MNLSDLKPNELNPRKISPKKLSMLKASLDKFGDLSGFVFNRRTGRLVSGHQRQKALEDSSINVEVSFATPTRSLTVAIGHVLINGERFKYREVDAPVEWENEAMLAANKHGGEWDEPLLKQILVSIPNVELAGFEIPEFQALNIPGPIVPKDEEKPNEKEASEKGPEEGEDALDISIPDVAKTKRGEIIALGRHTLLCGDCTDQWDIDKLFGERNASLAFTSPPYSDQRDYEGDFNLSPRHLAKFLGAPADIFAVNLGLKISNHEIVPYWDEYIDVAHSLGLKLLAWNVWDKMQTGGFGGMNAMFPKEHEWIFVFGKAPKELKKTEECKWAGQSKGANTLRERDGSLTQKKDFIVSDTKRMGSITHQTPYKARNEDLGGHPAVFPPALPEKYIEALTDEGDFVYEPFGGSGSTLIAAERLNRKCLIMELNPRFCDVIVTRYNNYIDKVRQTK